MPQVNYHLAKRKRDLAQQQKQEAKRQRKAERKKQRDAETPTPPPSA